MKQALHILRKDIRYLRLETGLIFGLSALYAWASTLTFAGPVVGSLLAVAAAYTLARLIHADPIPGDSQFWLTRPYRRGSLLAAKILGILLLLNMPMFFARLFVYLAGGFNLRSILVPLLWSQFLLFIGTMLPVAALASITRGIVPFTFIGLAFLTVGVTVDSAILPPSRPAVRMMLASSQWVWNTIVVLAIVLIAVPVLSIQYRTRRTVLSSCVIVLVSILGIAAYLYIPWPFAAVLQTAVSPHAFDGQALHIALDPSARKLYALGMMWRNGTQVDVPLSITGIPEDVELITDAISMTFRAADGSVWETGRYRYPALSKLVPGAGPTKINANVDVPRSFLGRAKGQPVKLTGTLYVTLFGNPESNTIPVAGRPVNAGSSLQCGESAFKRLDCRAPFRWPGGLVYANFGGDQVPFTRSISYSPFPAGIGFDGYENHQVGLPRGATEVTILVRQPLASLRRDFEIDAFPLAELTAARPGSE